MTTITNGLIEEFIRQVMADGSGFTESQVVNNVRQYWRNYARQGAVGVTVQEVWNMMQELIAKGEMHSEFGEYFLILKRENIHVVDDS